MSANFFDVTKIDNEEAALKRHLLLLDHISNMEIKDDDVWVCSYPRSGTTWTQEMVWSIVNDLKFDEAKGSLNERYVFLDVPFHLSEKLYYKHPSAKRIDTLLRPNKNDSTEFGPRFFKTHLTYNLLPKQLRDGSTKAKIVYVSRNPRDVCVSSFHHHKLMGTYKEDLDAFCDYFMEIPSKLDHYGTYWEHLFSFWNERHSKNLIRIKFEEMKMNLEAVVNKVATFFGKKFDEFEINALCEHLSFQKMKNNSAVNSDELTDLIAKLNFGEDKVSFIRRGDVNQWKSELSQTLIDRFAKWESENLQDIKLTYDNL